MYQVKKHGKTIAQFFSEQEANWFAVDKAIRDLREEKPCEEEEMEICYDEMPDYEILTEAGLEVVEVGEEIEGQPVAPEEVYDFLKVVWSDFETERQSVITNSNSYPCSNATSRGKGVMI